MKAVQTIGIFGAVSSTTVATLASIEAAASTLNEATSWAHEEVSALRADRAIKRDATREIWRTLYVLEAAQEVAAAHATANQQMANASPETKSIYDALVAKYIK